MPEYLSSAVARDTDQPADVLTALVDDLDAGFAGLVRAYEHTVYTAALRFCGHHTEAQDLTAESFLRAYRALRTYPPDRIEALRPQSWLLAILLNTWRNTLREASRRPQQTSVPEVPDQILPGPGTEEIVENGETGRELDRMVATLPRNQRVAVVLRHVVGLSSAETAAVMGIPEGTAKSHTSRGLRRLRELCAHRRPAGSVAVHPPVVRPAEIGRERR